MTKSPLLRALLALLVFPLLAGCGERGELPPNVVLISIDTLRADHLGVYGYERDTSPALDALARESLVFEQAFSHSPKTGPSHMSILTGLLPDSHGIKNLSQKDDNRALAPGVPTLATLLSERGYETLAVTARGHLSSKVGFDRGFAEFLQPKGEVEEIFELATERLSDLRREPFFMFLHTFRVHTPYTPPSPYREMWTDPAYDGRMIGDSEELTRTSGGDWAARHKTFWNRVDAESERDREHLVDLYDGAIRMTSDVIGRFLAELDDLGLKEHTIVVLLSDHGEEFYEHDGVMHDTVYQEVLHVPLILRIPERLRGERRQPGRVDSVARLVDVLPTVLELLGIAAPEHLQGQSLLDLAGGSGSARGVLSHWPRAGLYSLREGPWKLVRDRDGELELYDLTADPDEHANQASTASETRDRLAERLDALTQEARSLGTRFEPEAASGPSPEERVDLRALGYLQDGED